MRSTFKLLFYINRNKVKSDGTPAANTGRGSAPISSQKRKYSK